MSDLEILNPIHELKLGSETVSVKELAWPDAMAFLKKLGAQAGQFITSDGKFSVDTNRIAEITAGTQELSEWLILKSTGKDEAWLGQRSFAEGLELLDAALSVNVRPDFFDRFRQIGSRLAGALKNKSATSPQPSTSSSGKDTAAAT